jgi:pimeloyl-ACP methyl ester carboxylesterase
MLFTEFDGLSIAYQQVGRGLPLLVLHGFTQDSRVWAPQINSFSRQYTVFAWDSPGAGMSSDPPEPFDIADWVNSLDTFLDAVHVQRIHVVGLSWGGILAQEYLRLHSDRVISLVLADTYAGWKGSLPYPMVEERLKNCLHDASLPPRTFVDKYLPGMFSDHPPIEIRNRLASIMADFHPIGFELMAKASAQSDTRNLLPDIDLPTHLVWGESDKRSPLSIADQFRKAIPNSKLTIIPGAGHVCNLEAPDQFNAAVLRFYSNISSG